MPGIITGLAVHDHRRGGILPYIERVVVGGPEPGPVEDAHGNVVLPLCRGREIHSPLRFVGGHAGGVAENIGPVLQQRPGTSGPGIQPVLGRGRAGFKVVEVHVVDGAGVGQAPVVVAGLGYHYPRRRGVLPNGKSVIGVAGKQGNVVHPHRDIGGSPARDGLPDIGLQRPRGGVIAPGQVPGIGPVQQVRRVIAGVRGSPQLETQQGGFKAGVREINAVEPAVGGLVISGVAFQVGQHRGSGVLAHVEDVVDRGRQARLVESPHRDVIGGPALQGVEIHLPVGRVRGLPGGIAYDIGPILYLLPALRGLAVDPVLRRGQARTEVREIYVIDRAGGGAPGIVAVLQVADRRRRGILLHVKHILERDAGPGHVPGAQAYIVGGLPQRIEEGLRQRPRRGI